MKKLLFKSLIICLSVLTLLACKKFGHKFDTYFYTDTESSDGPLYLYIDGKNKGALPFLKIPVSTENDTVIKSALHLVLRSGNYKIEAKDPFGNLKFSGYLKFRRRTIGNGGTLGGQETVSSGDIIVTKIFY